MSKKLHGTPKKKRSVWMRKKMRGSVRKNIKKRKLNRK